MNDDWETIDANEVERFVEEGCKTMTRCVKYFKEQNISSITKIAEQVKVELDAFKIKVPILVALRKPGMMKRHWQ